MSHLPAAAHELFASQHGVASIEQLRAIGLSTRQLEHLRERGDLVRPIRGAYASPSVAETELMRCAAVTSVHPHAAVAGPTAGRLWGFRNVGFDLRIHVIVPRGGRATIAPWCVAYATDAIGADDIVERDDGIRVTSRARAALDLTRHIRSDDRLLSVIEQALHDGGLRDGDLRSVALDWATGRPWVRRFLRQLDRRLDGPAAESEPEVKVGQALAAAGVTGLVRQHPIDLPGYGRARFDLSIPDVRWACEVDVFPTHAETVGRAKDRDRDLAAESVGWRVFRISATDYRRRFERTIVEAKRDHARWAACSSRP